MPLWGAVLGGGCPKDWKKNLRGQKISVRVRSAFVKGRHPKSHLTDLNTDGKWDGWRVTLLIGIAGSRCWRGGGSSQVGCGNTGRCGAAGRCEVGDLRAAIDNLIEKANSVYAPLVEKKLIRVNLKITYYNATGQQDSGRGGE